jgi:hypothetical protein
MNKDKFKLLLGLVVFLIIFIFAFLAFLQNNESEIVLTEREGDNVIIFFTGDNCIHCKDVEDYIENHDILDKLDLVIREVYNNIENAKLFEEKFDLCSPQPRDYGVPLLWDNKFCLVGPIEIINYLENISN